MGSSEKGSERRFKGIAVSPGIAFGLAHVEGETFVEPERRRVGVEDLPREKERLRAALKATHEQIRALREELHERAGSAEASVFDAHLLLLDDVAVIEEVMRQLESERVGVDWAYYHVVRRYIDSLRKISDPYLRERAIDVEDVARRVLRNFRSGGKGFVRSLPGSDATHILLAHDLTPSDTVAIDTDRCGGFATELGSPTSHTAIMARSLNIPALVGLHHVLEHIHNGDSLLLDGYRGILILDPSPETLAEYEQVKREKGVLLEDLQTLREQETRSRDGRRVILSANIEFASEVPMVQSQGAEGVGLYRTEFFYLNEEKLRSEESQAANYSTVAKAMGQFGVIVRTLDVGGDKIWPEIYEEPEPNPFLGWRGIRVSLGKPEVFKEQLRAILRASAEGKVGLMYPFISAVEEVREANRLLDECKRELSAANTPFDEEIEVGAMIEIPSAALMADEMAAEVDFFSVGTNDLVQYTLAVDRVNERVADLYRVAHPAVIRSLKLVVEAAHRQEIWAGVCGEAAGDLSMVPILVGLGFDELSVGAVQVLRVRRAISRLDSADCRGLVEEVLRLRESSEVMARCEALAREHYPELMD